MAQYDIDIRDYWRIIKKRKPIIIFSMITMMIFSFIFAEYKKSKVVNIYASSATIRIDKKVTSNEFLMSTYSTTDDIDTEVKTITSFPVMAEVAVRFYGNDVIPDSLKALPDTVRNALIQSDPYLLRIVNNLTTMVQAERFQYTNIVTVHTTHLDPVMARDLAQHVVEAYREIRKKNANQRVLSAINYIKNQLLEIEARMDSLQVEIKSASKRDSLLSFYTESSILSDINTINKRKDEVDFRLLSTRSMIEDLEKGGVIDDSALSNAFAEEEGGIFREKYMALLRLYEARDEKLRYLTEEHPDVKNLTAQIENQKKLLVNQLKSNVQALERQKRNLDIRLVELTKRLDSINAKKESMKRLQDQYTILENRYYYLSDKLQDLEIKKSENVDEVTITRPAVINPNPINASTSVATITFIGLFLGTIIGLTAGFIFETLDTSIGTIEDVEAYLGVPVIGLIPQIGADEIRSNLYNMKSMEGKKVEVSDDQAMLVIYYAPKSILAEAFRSMRTNIQFISYEQEAKVLVFTSTSPGEGKTTSIVNLALTMAQSGNRILLIDADLRRPSIAGLFGLEKENGLSEILLGKRCWRECVRTVADIVTGSLGMSEIILEPGIDNLHIITCGTIPPNPSELLNSENTDEFIKSVREEYDMVLFDCAPTLPATDPAVLGRKTDGVIFVYAVGKVARGALKRAKVQMDNVKANVLGVVLNGIGSDVSADFQDYKYKDYYYAYAEEELEEKRSNVERLKKYVSDFIGRFV